MTSVLAKSAGKIVKLVRYYDSEIARIEFGVIVDDCVFRVLGDPLKSIEYSEISSGHIDEVTFYNPCCPKSIIGAALNYGDKPDLDPKMTEPIIFFKNPNSICSSTQNIKSPFIGENHWCEPELALVVSKQMKSPSWAEIPSSILGFCPANDVTVENLYGHDRHLVRGKAADTFCPIGPYIDTNFDFRYKNVEGLQNGEFTFAGNTNSFVWDPYRLVFELTKYMTLEPWDLVLTGAPSFTDGLKFIRPGDTYTVRIQGFPALSNGFEFLA